MTLKKQQIVIIIAILASFVAFLDGSVTNVALPQISQQLGGGLFTQQWVNDAYLITLGTLILAAGSLSDVFGRKRMLIAGLVGFLITSLLCAAAPTASALIIARMLQGMAGALLVPSSLALIISTFTGVEQAKAIGRWTGWTGIAFIIGPLVGGLMVDLLSWRLIFVINAIPIIIALLLLKKLHVDEGAKKRKRVDVLGIILGAIGLGGVVYALIEQGNYGWGSVNVYGSFIFGITLLVLFIFHERHSEQPMLPAEIFANRNFSVGNLATFFIYAALALQGFLLAIFLQQVAGYSATMAGLAFIPITVIMFLFSARFGTLAGKHGPRVFMSIGPIIAGVGTLYMLSVQIPTDYWTQLLPGIVLFGVGLSVTVAPLTSAILGSISPSRAGIGSAINNAVARIAGLLSIAAVGVFIGDNIDLGGFQRGIVVCSVLLVIGGIVSAIGIQNQLKQ